MTPEQLPLDPASKGGRRYRGESFGSLDVTHICLVNRDLQDADLERVSGLRASSLRGARLAGAKLPPYIDKFTLIDRTGEQAKLARTTLVSLLLAMTFYLLAVGRATDSELLLNAVSNKLPIIGVDVPIRTFYLFTPLLLAVIFGYANLYVLRMYESYLGLPAIFPDGLSRYEKVDSWLFSGLVVQLERDTVDAEIALLRLQYVLCIFLLHLTFPALLLYVWWRYLFSHDIIELSYLSMLSGLTVGMSAWFWSERSRMIHSSLGILRRSGYFLSLHSRWILSAGATAILVLVSIAATSGHVRVSWLPAAQLAGAVWTRPTPEWEERFRKTSGRQGAVKVLREIPAVRLTGRSLRGAYALGLVAINTDLSDADLSGADFSFSRLPGSAMRRATLRGTVLDGADLSYVDLSGSALNSVRLRQDATLQGANLTGSIIVGSELGGVDLSLAHLSLVKITSSRLEGVRARGVDFNSAELVDVALNRADLSGSKFRTARLKRVVLAGANLSGVDLTHAVFEHVNLAGANLSDVVGITEAQLRSACGDAMTLMDDKLRGFLRRC